MTTAGLLRSAINLHQSGNLDDAEKAYRLVLRFDPKNADALALLGNLLTQKKRADEAIGYIEQALAIDPDAGLFHFYLGNAYEAVHQHTRAEESFAATARLKPDWAEAFYNLANTQITLKKTDAAKENFLKAIELNPEHILAHNNLAHLYSKLPDYANAKKQLETALHHAPDNKQLLFSLYDIAFEHNDLPTVYDAAHRSAQIMLGIKGDAIIDYLADMRSIHTANDEIKNCLFLLGTSYLLKGELKIASYILRTLSALEPDLSEVPLTLGSILLNQNKYDDADAYYSQAFMLNPAELSAPWNRSMNLLVAGNLGEGFRRYRWRWSAMDKFKAMRMKGEMWDGSNPAGKTILVQEEQGFGDTLHMLRYIPMLKEKGATVYAYVRPVLYPLLENWDGASKVVEWNVADKLVPKDVDAICGMMDLPSFFETSITNIPAQVPYLPNPKKGDAKFKLHGDGFKVGIVWAGNPLHKRDHERSIPFQMWDTVLKTKGVTFYSLQHKPKESDITLMHEYGVLDLAPNIKNLADTAATLAELDLLITIDSAPAHLAGALGLPVWVLVTKNPDWRWLEGRDDSPWYPSLRLFRQPVIGDWGSVMANVCKALESWRLGAKGLGG